MESEAKNTIRTKPEEFIKFHNALMASAPEGYIPYYFPVVVGNKAPDPLDIAKRASKETVGKARFSWKEPHARLTYEEALLRLKEGKNIGISARSYDKLVIIDIDDIKYKNQLPNTLTDCSRKRVGWHGYCWAEDERVKVNIPTEFGEVRSSDQYVVAAGSFCTTSEKDIDEEPITDEIKKKVKDDPLLGCYTVEKEIPPIFIGFDELPEIFKIQKKEGEKKPIIIKPKVFRKKDGGSALFDLKITDILGHYNQSARVPHPLHSSDTGMNFSITGELAHCWRHLVSLNAIQYLCVQAGYLSCLEAGTGHNGSGAGSSKVVGDAGAIFYAWLEAKRRSFISKSDPIPITAMYYIAKKHKIIRSNGKLGIDEFNRVIDIIEAEY